MSKDKKMLGHVRNMIIGGFTVCGLAILVGAIFFFKPSVGDNKNKLTIHFANIEGIDVGTRVTYAGRPVGEVVSISYIPREQKKGVDAFGNPYSFEVKLRLDSSIHIYSTDLIEIRTLGLLGEKSIAIIPQSIQENSQSKPIINGVIYANSEDPLSSTLKTVQVASEEIARTMSNFSSILEENRGRIDSSVKNLNHMLEGMSQIVQKTESLNLLDHFNHAIVNISDLTQNANEMLDKAKKMHLLEKMDGTLENLSWITENIANGKGTLGKLVNDPTLYLKTLSTLDRVNQLIYDLNHFGLLFHRNRNWKEQQKLRLEQIEQLKSPDAFTEAFEKEMHQINQSLERVSQMVDQAEMGQEEVLESQPFKKAFFELLQQVNHLQNLIDLYNQKVSDS